MPRPLALYLSHFRTENRFTLFLEMLWCRSPNANAGICHYRVGRFRYARAAVDQISPILHENVSETRSDYAPFA